MASKQETTNNTQAAQNIEIPAMPLNIGIQYIKDLSFENPDPLQSFQESSAAPEIALNIDVSASNVGEHMFEVTLHLLATAKREEQKLFVVELAYAGIFTFNANVPQEAMHPLLMIECPRLLFPYARTILANATREGGFPSLALSPIDFLELYRRQHAAAEEGQGTTTAETQAKSGS